VRLAATGQSGSATRTLAAEYVRLPHEALKCAVYARTTLGLQDVRVEGRLRANDNVYLPGGPVAVRGDITTRNGATIDTSLADADTDTFYVATAQPRPDPGFNWFKDAGEKILLPFTRIYDGMILAPGYSNESAASGEGIYYIDAAGGPVTIRNSVLIACLAVLNASTVSIEGPFGSVTRYHHESPDPDRLPALLVQGNLTMRIEYAEWSATILMVSQSFTSGLEGVFFCTGSFWGPQLSASKPIEVHGAILGADVHLVGAGTFVRHNLDLNLNPVAEFTLSGLRLIPNTRREL
jgi:hypothetical protein